MQSAFRLSRSALDAINVLESNSANVQQQALQHYMFEESVGTPLISSKITCLSVHHHMSSFMLSYCQRLILKSWLFARMA